MVLRVFDNRLLHTDRRPDMYLDEDLDEKGRIVCQISDTAKPEDALPFGARIEVDSSSGSGSGTSSGGGTRSSAGSKEVSSSSRDWLWAKKGQFVAILVPYRHGRHYATNIKDFKPILKHLRRLHENGFVHGDIRGFNMAMKNENEGYLIDLDYGGKVDGSPGNAPRYPEGYKFGLDDGDREERQERSIITMKDDLQAITNLMWRLYVPGDDYQGIADSYFGKRKDLVEGAARLEEGSREAALRFNDTLHQCADKAGWSVTPATSALLRALKRFGYDLEREAPDQAVKRCVGTDPATGSPAKQQKG
jgi:hypothetical protein